MKKFLLILLLLSLLLHPSPARAPEASTAEGPENWTDSFTMSLALPLTGEYRLFKEIQSDAPMNQFKFMAHRSEKNQVGLLPFSGHVVALLYQQQPSSREYIADILNNIGVPTVSRAYAQGTGYKAMSPFLVFWKGFRNLAYSLYIIMFVVVGVMIMLRTKVSAKGVITIQSALPNLLITLLLITFSYAIVGFMIDLMYFLIYFIVYLFNSINIISTPLKAIDRLLSYSAYGVIFEGRNSILSAITVAIDSVLSGLGTGAIGAVGKIIAALPIMYLIVAVAFTIAMIKLMVALLKSYVMLIVQTVTAPVQILLNALPGSKAFSGWLKKTASYLIPFPVAAAMFIFSAILIGDPTNSTVFGDIFKTGNKNPFGINSSHEFYDGYGGFWKDGTDKIWMPPFTLTGNVDLNTQDILTIIGFIVFLMTPAAVKMAQEWLQIKESPYTAEAMSGISTGVGLMQYPIGLGKGIKQQAEQRRLMQDQASWIGKAVSQNRTTEKP